MTYNITVGGHLDSPDQEAEVLEKAKEFVGSLDGVTTGNFSGMHSGSVSLLAAPEPPGDGETATETPSDDPEPGED